LLTGTAVEFTQRFGLKNKVRSCHDYPRWRWDGVEFRFLSVTGLDMSSTNDRSCVLQIKGAQIALLPGDIGARQEARLIDVFDVTADLLLAPHHGSASSSSEAFLQAVNPKTVIFSLSRGNRWGFPRDSVVERYRQLGSRQLRTDRDGAVTVSSTAAGLKIDRVAGHYNRIWR